jgi:trigger factor
VKELKLPDLDDDFAKDLGHDSAAAMRKSVEEDCRRMVESTKTDEAFDAIVKKLADAAEFEVPESLRESVQRDIMRSDLNFVYSTGVAPPRYRGKSRQEYREQVGVDAMSRVKGYLILDAIGKKENIEAAEEDINAALEERAREEGRKPVAIRAALEKRREWDHFVDQARFDKIRAFLLSKAKINWVEPKTPEASEEPKAE